MPLIPQATLNAAKIDDINVELTTAVRNLLTRSYALVMTDPQGVLDALGTNASDALTRYVTFFTALQTIGEASELTAPNYDAFQPQQDGTVLYTAPPEPEPLPAEPE